MPEFQYESLSSDGNVQSGVVSAADRPDAVRVLRGRGETATTVTPVNGSGGSATLTRPKPRPRPSASRPSARGDASGPRRSMGLRSGRPTMKRAELAALIRELATALEAGLPLMQSLRTVRRQASGRAQPVILDHMIERVERGDPLYMAAKDYGPPFDEMIVGMLRAADASGEMSTVMHQLADLLERSVELRREVMGATFYPAIVAFLLVGSIIVLVTVLVPRLIGPMSQEAGFAMPWPTAVVLGVAEFLQAYWFICLGAMFLAGVGWHLWSRVPANRFLIDRTMLRVPVLGKLLRDVAVARFTRTLGTLTAAGLAILDALRITRATLGNRALIAAIEEVEEQVTSGKALADPLERSGLFPPLLVQVVNLGERSGRLDQMLLHAATAFDRQVNTSLKIFSKALPPFLLIIMAAFGGFVLAAILLPLLELQNMVR